MATGGGIGGDITPKSKFTGILMASFAAFGGVLYGYDTVSIVHSLYVLHSNSFLQGVINGLKVMPAFLKTFGSIQADGEYGLSTNEESLIVSILSAGTFCGALLGAPIGDWIGRKFGIMIGCVLFCIGVGMQTGADAQPLYIVGRVFAGLGVGVISCLVPMYQSEWYVVDIDLEFSK